MIQQIIFLVVLGGFAFVIFRRFKLIIANINIGKENKIHDNVGERWKNVLLVAFGQQKMFKRPIPALLHFFVYVGFLVINLEVLEFVIDGLAGTHRIFAPFLGDFYTVLMNVFEFLAIGVLVSC